MGLRHSNPVLRQHLRTIVALLLLLPLQVGATMLRVERSDGGASLKRQGQLITLRTGLPLRHQDLVTSLGAEPVLALGRYGRLRLGPGAMLGVGKLPSSAYAEDLETVLQLRQGYLRMVWKRPDLVTPWPLYVQLGEFRLRLSGGDFHFEAVADGQHRFCVAEGEVQVPSHIHPLALKAPACFALAAGHAPRAVLRSAGDFVAMAQASTIGSLPRPLVPLPRAPEPQLAAAPAATRAAVQLAVREVSPEPRRARRVRRAAALPVGGPENSSGAWVLNICSSNTREEAERQRGRLREAGFDPDLQTVEVNGQSWHRLRLVSLPSRDRADQLAQQLRRQLGYPSPWISRG